LVEAEFPADYQKATAALVQQGNPSFTVNDGSWFQDEPAESKLLGVNGRASNSWLLFPAIYLNSVPGNVTLDFIARTFYKSGQEMLPVFDTCKTLLYVLAASTRDSLNGNHIMDTLDIVSLTTEWSPVSINLSALTEHTHLAFFIVRDMNNAASNVYLQVDSFDIDYRSVTCLGVSNIATSNLTAESVTISWDGTASEYGVFYTNTTTEKEDTVYSTSTSVNLTSLDNNTTYTFYVQPYCGENHTNPGPASSEDGFTTLEAVGNSASALSKKFEVSSNAGRISILNPSAIKMDRVEVTGTSGAVLQQKNAKTSGNVLLPAIKTPQVAIVKITSGNDEYTYKILVK
jgi:hypothetical protein